MLWKRNFQMLFVAYPEMPDYYERGDALMKRLKKPLTIPGEDALEILLWTLRVCCVMLLCSLALLIHTGGLSPRTYELYRLAAELESSSAGFLLCGNFAALLAESLHRR